MIHLKNLVCAHCEQLGVSLHVKPIDHSREYWLVSGYHQFVGCKAFKRPHGFPQGLAPELHAQSRGFVDVVTGRGVGGGASECS